MRELGAERYRGCSWVYLREVNGGNTTPGVGTFGRDTDGTGTGERGRRGTVV